MISSVKISGFRGLSDCKLKGLKTVNVFTGRNNNGKSSILEALFLSSGAYRFSNPWETRNERNDKIEYLLNRRSKGRQDKDALWYNYDSEKPILIEIVIKGKKYEFRLVNWHPHPFLNFEMTEYLGKAFKDSGFAASREHSHLCLVEGAIFSRRESFTLKGNLSGIMDQYTRFSRIEQFMNGMMFVDSNLVRDMETVENTLWEKLLKKRSDKLVTQVLREGYEINVEDLTYMPFKNRYQLAAKLPETTIRVDDLGDGARYSMIWIMVAALARKTAILMEEPENHQHPGGLVKSLEMLLDIIKGNEDQLFITTHSLEFIRMLEIITKEKKIDMTTFFVEMDEAGKIDSRVIKPEDSEYLTKMGLDMRFLDIL